MNIYSLQFFIVFMISEIPRVPYSVTFPYACTPYNVRSQPCISSIH